MQREERIREMEARLNRVLPWLSALENVMDARQEVLQDLKALESYYGSPLWRQDYEADEAGLLPPDLPRGVLSEDGIWNALADYRALSEACRALPGAEPWELKSARYLAADILRQAVRPGDTVVDATMGNGHDTLFLCSLVGPSGKVYAFDVQPQAAASAGARLEEAGMRGRAELFCLGHEHMAEKVPGPVQAVMFNLGWLPGGDHSVTTQTDTTLQAVRQALSLLLPLGVLVVCVYPGHPEGARELEALSGFFSGLSPRQFNVLRHTFPNAGPGAPHCFAVQKQRPAGKSAP